MITKIDYQELEGMEQWMMDVPFEVVRYQLYDVKDLYKGYEPSADAEKDKASFTTTVSICWLQPLLLL